MSHQLIATSAFGLEAVVKRELQELGLEGQIVQPGSISFSGTSDAIIGTNLSLRTADRVLIQVAEFPAPDFDALFETTKSIDWAKWIPPQGRFPVKGRSINSQLSSVPACQRSVNKAIVESLKSGHGIEDLPENGPTYQVEIAIRNDVARLTIDTTGPSLHKRGYRKKAGSAPLKETLAAAMVLLSVWTPERPLVDPFCGSGTIPVEAAMIAGKIAPGLNREFPSESWDLFLPGAWNQKREELRQVASENSGRLTERILATDIDPSVLELARRHAVAAGVESQIHFQQRSFEDLRSRKEFGCIITNPPYGERLKERDLTRFYQMIPQILQRLPTWSHFILTAFPRFEAVIQKSASRRRKLYNGRIECMYYQFLGPKPPRGLPDSEFVAKDTGSLQSATGDPSLSPGQNAEEFNIADSNSHSTDPVENKTTNGGSSRPVFGGISQRTHGQAELFSNRLRKRARHLRRWPKRGISCYRLYEKDIPEIPWIVDRYEDRLHIVEYERPHDRDISEHASWQELMCKTAAKTLEVDINKVFFKTKTRQKRTSQHEKLNDTRSEFIVNEGGLKFLVNLSDYVDTGLFLDHRLTRQRVREESNEKNVLNLFGYTGSFSVYAADGGAQSVVHVDSSRTYVDWARRNMSINRFHGLNYRFEITEVQKYLDGLPEKSIFDLVIADPPTFSNSKQSAAVWDVQQQHFGLLTQIKKHLSPEGVIYFSTNFRRFKLEDRLSEHFSEVREISRQTVPEDFRNKRIHRCWKIIH